MDHEQDNLRAKLVDISDALDREIDLTWALIGLVETVNRESGCEPYGRGLLALAHRLVDGLSAARQTADHGAVRFPSDLRRRGSSLARRLWGQTPRRRARESDQPSRISSYLLIRCARQGRSGCADCGSQIQESALRFHTWRWPHR